MAVARRATIYRRSDQASYPVAHVDRRGFKTSYVFELESRGYGEENSSTKGKFTEALIVFVLKQTDEGTAMAEVCR